MKQETEFYIGWQATTPPSFAKIVRGFVVGLCVLIPLLIIAMVWFQKGFSNGRFDYGKTSRLEGVFTQTPFPFLQIENGKDAHGDPVFQKILLVGSGKFGFWADPANVPDGASVIASGFLIYNDGKTALQVENIQPIAGTAPQQTPRQTRPITQQSITLRGEITDPKCLLGVMNPGQGKPHLDCAVRCISGGLPPVLKVSNAGGDTEYYLLIDPDGKPLNDRVLDFVGQGVELCGRLEQLDDWWVLSVDPGQIRRIHKASLQPGPMCE